MDPDHWNNVYLKDGLTVVEIIQLLEYDIHGILDEEGASPDVQEIFIAPPPANELTGEDSGDEDSGGLQDNFTCQQLISEAEAVLSNRLLHLGKDYPQGFDFFRTRLKSAFLKNKDVTDAEQVKKMIGHGDYVVKELEALYMLKKYRTLKRRYENQDQP